MENRGEWATEHLRFQAVLSMRAIADALLTHEITNWPAIGVCLGYFIHGAPTDGSIRQYCQVALSNIPGYDLRNE